MIRVNTKDAMKLAGLTPDIPAALGALATLKAGTGRGNDFIGWRTLHDDIMEDLPRIKACAERIREDADVFVVIGVGGSYLGARAALEFLQSPTRNLTEKGPIVLFSGYTLSGEEMEQILKLSEGKKLYLNVISKSGTTLEPALSFRFLRDVIEKTCTPEEARKRIVCTTGIGSGVLYGLAQEKGYECFAVPEDVGGRFSVLSAVGLLPLAVAGVDVDALLEGCRAQAKESLSESADNPSLQYAAARQGLYDSGIKIEMLSCSRESHRFFGEWWKQLIGESQGKEHTGIFPNSMVLTADLHSLGQYMQDGERIMFETFLRIGEDSPLRVKAIEGDLDGLNYLEGMSYADVFACAAEGTKAAHEAGGVPCMEIFADKADEEELGRLIFFFEAACAISGYMQGVNPFDQPAVNEYKNRMFELLKKQRGM